MSERDSLPGRRKIDYAAISVIIMLVTMGAGLVTQWTVMTEAKHNAETRDIEQNQRIDGLARQVRDLETNRTIEMRIAELSTAVARVETEVSGMRRDMRGRK